MADSDTGIPALKSRAELPGRSLLEHLEELRKRVLYSIAGMFVGFCACYGYAEEIYAFVQRPVTEALKANNVPTKLVFLNPKETFELLIQTCFVAGTLLALPFSVSLVRVF